MDGVKLQESAATTPLKQNMRGRSKSLRFKSIKLAHKDALDINRPVVNWTELVGIKDVANATFLQYPQPPLLTAPHFESAPDLCPHCNREILQSSGAYNCREVGDVLRAALLDIQKQLDLAEEIFASFGTASLATAAANSLASAISNSCATSTIASSAVAPSGTTAFNGGYYADNGAMKRVETIIRCIQKKIISSAVRQSDILSRPRPCMALSSQISPQRSLDDSVTLNCPSFKQPLIVLTEGFYVEISNVDELIDLAQYASSTSPTGTPLISTSEHSKIVKSPYLNFFVDQPHSNFLGLDVATQNPIIISLSPPQQDTTTLTPSFFLRGIVWTKELIQEIQVPVDSGAEPTSQEAHELIVTLALAQFHDILLQRSELKNDCSTIPSRVTSSTSSPASFRSPVPSSQLSHSVSASAALSALTNSPDYTTLDLRLSKDADVNLRLARLEVGQKEPHYKIGVLYARAGQTTEEEMFQNRDEDASLEFRDFLKILGDQVELKGWQGYRGGLDVKLGTTGEATLYRNWQEIEIIFHVSTLLPFDQSGVKAPAPTEQQQISRKRHIGNDMCVIVFIDGNTPFSSDTITSQYCHVFAIVRPVPGGYSFAMVMKSSVPMCEPNLPSTVFARNVAFTDFLICKLINAQISAYAAPIFKQKLERTRLLVLNEIIQASNKDVKKNQQVLTITAKAPPSNSTNGSPKIAPKLPCSPTRLSSHATR